MTLPPRKLPFVARDPKLNVEHALGNFVAQPVGSTSYCKGIHVHAHLHGEEEAVRGVLSYGAVIHPDGTVTWERQQLGYCEIQDDRADEVEAAALEIAGAFIERDPIHCAIYYSDVAEMELRELHRKIRDEVDTRDHLTKLLADPDEPKLHNVKNDDGEWERIPYTPAEKVEYRERWERNVARAVKRLAKLHREHDPRITQLKSVMERCRAFWDGEIDQLLPFDPLGG
jgi:hypothetical protein